MRTRVKFNFSDRAVIVHASKQIMFRNMILLFALLSVAPFFATGKSVVRVQ